MLTDNSANWPHLRENSRCLNIQEAANYLGVGYETIINCIHRGIIKPFYLPATGKTPIARIRIEELDQFIFPDGPQMSTQLVDPRKMRQIPKCLVARILGISEAGVSMALAKGTLKDRTPESVRRYLIRQVAGRIKNWLRMNARRYLKITIDTNRFYPMNRAIDKFLNEVLLQPNLGKSVQKHLRKHKAA